MRARNEAAKKAPRITRERNLASEIVKWYTTRPTIARTNHIELLIRAIDASLLKVATLFFFSGSNCRSQSRRGKPTLLLECKVRWTARNRNEREQASKELRQVGKVGSHKALTYCGQAV